MTMGRAVRRFNGWIDALRTAPLTSRLMSRYVTTITYTGRRSGQTFSTPVAFRRRADVVTISVRMAELKNWWRNFTGDGGPISVELDGRDRAGHAIARRDARGRTTVTIQLTS